MTADELRMLDVEVHRKVFGRCVELCEDDDHFPLCVRWYDCSDMTSLKLVPPYSTDIAAAWRIVEKLRSSGIYLHVGYNWCDVYEGKYGSEIQTFGTGVLTSAPLAICTAALKAVDKG